MPPRERSSRLSLPLDTLLIVDPDEVGRSFVCAELAADGRHVHGVATLAEARAYERPPTMALIAATYAIRLGTEQPNWNPESLAPMCVVYSMRELEDESWLVSLPTGVTAIVTHDLFPALPHLVGAQLTARWRILTQRATPAPTNMSAKDPGWIPRPEDFSITEDDPVDLKVYEIKAILRAISCASGNRQRAAELLGIGKSTLYRRLAEWRDA